MNIVLFLIAAACLAAYVCRLDALQWKVHRASFIVIHLVQAGTCAWVLTQAAQGEQTVGCFLALAGSAMWLWVSFYSWRGGPPPHTLRPVSARS